ncbi:MAG: ATP-binding cassette domain-containing protein [Solirubrobacteraceae bacterium]
MPLLALENVSKSYRSGTHRTIVLRDACMSVAAGECVAIWGQRASGKTTLLNVAAGRQAPELGTVLLDGSDIYREQPSGSLPVGDRVAWAHSAGWEAEGLETLDYMALSLLEGAKELRRARRESWEALASLGVSHIARTRCELLAGYERAAMSIARAMARRPSVLIADEPAAHLTAAERGSLMALLRKTAEERSLAVLVTVSDIPSMVHAHRAGSLSEGLLSAPEPAASPLYDNVVEFPSRGYATG